MSSEVLALRMLRTCHQAAGLRLVDEDAVDCLRYSAGSLLLLKRLDDTHYVFESGTLVVVADHG